MKNSRLEELFAVCALYFISVFGVMIELWVGEAGSMV
jgi:hypothetical protein